MTKYDVAAETFLVLNENTRLLTGNWVWLEACRRWTPEPLAVYHHLHTDALVMGAWVVPPEEAVKPILQELEIVEGDPHSWWPFPFHPRAMRYRLRPVREVVEDEIKRQKERAARKRLEAAEKAEEAKEKADLMRWAGYSEQDARLMELGGMPFASKKEMEGGTAL